MYQLLCPRMTANHLPAVQAENLIKLGIQGVILDLDNTIIAWDSTELCPEAANWIRGAQSAGLKVGLVSNNHRQRVESFAVVFGIPFASRAFKPAKSGFRQVIEAMTLTADRVAVIGDQLFTDILGGNRLGCYTIWVKPISAQEFVGTKLTRQLEKLTVRFLESKKMM